MSIVSTVPAAACVLAAYMQQVSANNAGLQAGAYLGVPAQALRPNYMMVGDATGRWFNPETYSWAAMPGQARLRLEKYALVGTIRAYSGAADITGRHTDMFTMLNGLQELLVADPGGLAEGMNVQTPAVAGAVNLSPSGSWGDLTVTETSSGQLNGQGWGVVITFELSVINAQLQG